MLPRILVACPLVLTAVFLADAALRVLRQRVERGLLLAAVLVLAALLGVTWYLFRARAGRRRLAAWDVYAEQELAKRRTFPTKL
jgi:hypothetical protein